MADTVRELAVKLQMAVDKGSFGQADKAISGVKNQAQSLGSQFSAIAGRAAVFIGIASLAHKAKEAFIDFNSNVEQSTISLAAVQKMFKGGTWSDSMDTATKLFEHYQDVAKASVGETKDFIEMHKAIAASGYQAGASLEDLKEITKGAVIASTSMGESAIVSAMDVKQALSKGVSVRDRFMMNLLAAEKVTAAQFNAMNKQNRVATLRKALTADWIKDASKQMEGSFAGVVSTLKDNVSIALGKVGVNSFKSVTDEIKSWNTWIEKNGDSWKKFQGLVETGLTAAHNIAKGIMATLQVAVLPVMKVFEGLQEIQDMGRYEAGLSSRRGLREAYEKGPEEYDKYVREKIYGQNVSGKKSKYIDEKGQAIPDLGRPTTTRAEVAEGIGKFVADLQNADAQGKAGGFLLSNLGAVARGVTKTTGGFIGRGIEGPGGFAVRKSMEIARGAIEGGDYSYHTGPDGRYVKLSAVPGSEMRVRQRTQSTPEPNYASQYGPVRYVPQPDIYAPGAASIAGPARVSGDINIKVKVDVPNIQSRVEEVLTTKFREGNELFSSQPDN